MVFDMRQLQLLLNVKHIVRKVLKMSHLKFFFWYWYFQNVNVARFARNVEWDFFCDFQTPWLNARHFWQGSYNSEETILH